LQPRLLLPVIACLAYSFPLSAEAMDARLQRSLLLLDPDTRVIQVCDIAALAAVSRDASFRRVDKVMIDALSTPKGTATRLTGDGGALRQKDEWFKFSYVCTVNQGALEASAFNFKIAGAIPKSDWKTLGLW
jgi:hypothetical protein